MPVLKNIGAVVAGVAFVVITSTGTDLALQHTLLPAMNTREATPPVLALALAYRTAYGIIAGWLNATRAESSNHSCGHPRCDRNDCSGCRCLCNLVFRKPLVSDCADVIVDATDLVRWQDRSGKARRMKQRQ